MKKHYTVGQYASLRGVNRQTVHIWLLKKKDSEGNKIKFKTVGEGTTKRYLIIE